MVRASVWLPGIQPAWKSIDFLLDTGAGTTSLHPLDSIVRIGIPIANLIDPSQWPEHETHGGIGGKAIYFLTEAHYAFLKSDGEWHRIHGKIRIAEATLGNLSLPSLLGWDVLQEFHVATDWANRTVTLT